MKAIVIEPEGVDIDNFIKDLVEMINEGYADNLPFEFEVHKH